jgi:hypothetical protein
MDIDIVPMGIAERQMALAEAPIGSPSTFEGMTFP